MQFTPLESHVGRNELASARPQGQLLHCARSTFPLLFFRFPTWLLDANAPGAGSTHKQWKTILVNSAAPRCGQKSWASSVLRAWLADPHAKTPLRKPKWVSHVAFILFSFSMYFPQLSCINFWPATTVLLSRSGMDSVSPIKFFEEKHQKLRGEGTTNPHLFLGLNERLSGENV